MTDDETVQTGVEVDEEVWRQFRADSELHEGTLSDHLERVLRDYYDMGEGDGE